MADNSQSANPPAKAGDAWREWLRVGLPAAVVLALVFLGAWHFVRPAPPARVVIATGSKEGMYYAFGQRYRDYFAKNGIDLEVRETAGSVENFKLLADPASGVDVAIVQGGTAPPRAERKGIEAVAGIYFEPVCVFYRGSAKIGKLADLVGKRIAVGKEGSGVRPVATMLLKEAGVEAKDAAGTQLIEVGSGDAADQLVRGDIDAAFYVISPNSDLIGKLLAAPGVQLMSFDQARAYARRHPFYSAVILHRGSVNVQKDLPAEDVHLIAAPATIAIRDSTHEAVIELLVRAAQTHHTGAVLNETDLPDLLADPGTFPSADRSELPVNKDARIFLVNKPGFLQRTFPFWLASLIDRTLILVLPLLAVALPLIRMMPPIYAWRIKRRIFKWYRQLRRIDDQIVDPMPPGRLENCLRELDVVEKEVAAVKVPLSYAEQLYNLRTHIKYVRERLQGHSHSAGGGPAHVKM